jgi:hypothetical protein
MDVDNSVQTVILAGQQDFGFRTLDELFEILKLQCEFVADGFALAGEVHQRFDVVDLASNLPVEFEGFFEAGSLLKNRTGTLLIGPEVRLGDDLLQIVELPLLGRSVKGTSALPGYGF